MKLALLLLAISFTTAQFPPIALLHTEPSYQRVADVLKGFAYTFNVTTYNVSSYLPYDLSPFAAVFVMSGQNPFYLGDVLARYVRGGGGLVLCNPLFYAANALSGDWNPSFSSIAPGWTSSMAYNYTMVPLVGYHPLLDGVGWINSGLETLYGSWNYNSSLYYEQIAQWSDGSPLVGVTYYNSSKIVSLGIYPPSTASYSYGWTGNGTRLFINSVNYVLTYVPPPPSTCSYQYTCYNCTSFGCQWCLDTNTCTDFNTSCPDRIANPAYCPSNCGSYYDCNSCLTYTSGKCSWCLDTLSCVRNTVYCRGEINNAYYCPTIQQNDQEADEE